MEIRCPRCEGENLPAFRFCGHCGASLLSPCPACASPMPPGFAFCGFCGRALPGGAPGEAGAARPPSRAMLRPLSEAPAGAPAVNGPAAADTRPDTASTLAPGGDEQRRRVAILFADLKGSTALADHTEAETAYRVVSGFL